MSAENFTPGQRWICDAELQLGLGTVLSSDFRTVTILFSATEEQRTYAKQSAPLTRVKFSPGDSVQSQEGWSLSVEGSYEEDGLITYVGRIEDGTTVELGEVLLNNFIQLNRPVERLFSNQLDSDKWFELRYQTHLHRAALSRSEIAGLAGGRTSHIPHQLYIAHEVAHRYAPRVLLADEVGLGKTIEAGLILHQQLLSERARRVLIVVPESLVHQWLVEMLRRFNLHFTILDEPRCQALDESSGQSNPFHTEQLILCNLEFLVSNPLRFQQALQGEWDLLVVDEAHHLEWSAQAPSIEYQAIEALAQVTQGVLLLTATPEQLGKESHFARLRLLDSDRFSDYQTFLNEEEGYRPIADTVALLISGESLDEGTNSILQEMVGEGDNRKYLELLQNDSATADEQRQARARLIEHLLDRHGTGRVLFRNTRDAVKGFPQREVTGHPLPLPVEYQAVLNDLSNGSVEPITEAQLLLSPELLYQSQEGSLKDWTEIDPRVEWLTARIKALYPAKVLVITSSAQSAIDIAGHLLHRAGIHAALFHEGLSIIERDRAAAFFADHESGSQLLVCSEIGSEGRNFQFAHHLIMFDLPLNPDLLEQRIGRLDRIGQRQTIEIEVPYLQQSPQEVIYRWYHEGLNAFEHNSPAGHAVFEQVQQQLLEQLDRACREEADVDSLIKMTRGQHHSLKEALQQGRNRLLEYSSCRSEMANQLQALAQYEDTVSELGDYLDDLFDCFGVDIEPHTSTSHIIRPGERMQTGSFPMLTEDGMIITYNREMALSHEDIHFITWAHPLVSGAMELIESSELGNSALTSVKYSGVNAGTLLLEVLYQLESTSKLSNRYLPPLTIRVVIDPQGRDHASKLTSEMIAREREFVKKETARTITRAYAQELQEMVDLAEQAARRQLPEILGDARAEAQSTLSREVHRLKALQSINPNIRQSEIDFFEQELEQATAAVASANLRLDALRVIVVT
ncbi:MAG TPA: RNA polymerase-associated protein RapA [Ectothiorhodospiraceae bacterium]|nr:RNA polymerase-associated protein RapA [Ectothiorhodospiraceae bacterium]